MILLTSNHSLGEVGIIVVVLIGHKIDQALNYFRLDYHAVSFAQYLAIPMQDCVLYALQLDVWFRGCLCAPCNG